MNKKGFTLIELLVVIAIIALLSILAIVALGSAREKSRDQKRISDIKQIQTALELYFADQLAYPVVENSQSIGTGNYACLNSSGFSASGCANAYMAQIPSDPSSGEAYTYSGATSTYTITATLEGSISNLSPGKIIITPSGISNQ